jgi:hypothetical protein
MFLRGTDGEWVTEHADGDGARGVKVDPDNAERSWCCLAWPVRAGWTGQPVYFVDQSGEVLAFANTDGAFSGERRRNRGPRRSHPPVGRSRRRAASRATTSDGVFDHGPDLGRAGLHASSANASVGMCAGRRLLRAG